jgi:hypothetical protein
MYNSIYIYIQEDLYTCNRGCCLCTRAFVSIYKRVYIHVIEGVVYVQEHMYL